MDLTEFVRPIVANRRIVLAVDALAGATRMVGTLRDLGAASIAVVSSIDGIGDLPTDIVSIRVPSPASESMMGAIRHFQVQLAALAPEVLDGWDPDRSALFLAGPFDGEEDVAGRSAFGGRPAAFAALEDKTIIDDVWDRAGVVRSPSRVVPAARIDLLAAASDLDTGDGTVWVADNAGGWHGGGDFLRWVRGPDHVDDVVSFFEAHARRVRVMPFLDGIPCSIHGIVLPDRVLAFRPIEMVILRQAGLPTIQYAGLASVWDPPKSDREEMRSVVRRVGALLRADVGYRGAFGIDGIMTAEGFRPTELNPRLSGGLSIQAGLSDDLYLGLVNRTLLSGRAPNLDWDRLEAEVVAAADARRMSRCISAFALAPPDWDRLDLAWDGSAYRTVNDIATAEVTLRAGSHPMGCAVLTELLPMRTEPGPPFGPRVVAALDVARRHGLAIPELTAASDVRSG